jgi:hypothetical protein
MDNVMMIMVYSIHNAKIKRNPKKCKIAVEIRQELQYIQGRRTEGEYGL